MLVFLAVMVVFVVVGIAAWTMRNRTERGIESGISSFRRELDALAPRGEPKARPLPRQRPASEDDDDDEPEFRTVQIGDKPPPRKLTPPTAPAEAAAVDDESDDDDRDDVGETSRDGESDGTVDDAVTDEERADGT